MGVHHLLFVLAVADHRPPQPVVARWRDHANEQLERWRCNLPRPAMPQLPQLQLPQLPKLPWQQSGGGGGGGGAIQGRDELSIVSDSAGSGEEWSLVLERDGVRVWRRPRPGSPNDEVRGNGIIKAPPRAVIALLRKSDEETIRKYNPMYDKGHDLETFDANTKVSYGTVRAIFPFKPRDTVTHVAFRELSQLKPMGGTAILQQAVAHPAMPPRSGYVRAEILRGVFVVQPVRGNARVTNFTFSQQVKVGGIVPAWLMNTLIAQDAVVFVKRLGKAASKHEKSLR